MAHRQSAFSMRMKKSGKQSKTDNAHKQLFVNDSDKFLTALSFQADRDLSKKKTKSCNRDVRNMDGSYITTSASDSQPENRENFKVKFNAPSLSKKKKRIGEQMKNEKRVKNKQTPNRKKMKSCNGGVGNMHRSEISSSANDTKPETPVTVAVNLDASSPSKKRTRNDVEFTNEKSEKLAKKQVKKRKFGAKWNDDVHTKEVIEEWSAAWARGKIEGDKRGRHDNFPEDAKHFKIISQEGAVVVEGVFAKKVRRQENEGTPFSSKRHCNQSAINSFADLIYPITLKEFFEDIWEKRPLLVLRADGDYYKNTELAGFDLAEVERTLREESVRFTEHLDVVKCVDGVRHTVNPEEGAAIPSLVWRLYKDGCSIRLKNPQAFTNCVHRFCSDVQEFLGSYVGCNFYLTPSDSQGFAPHFDDIEAFVVQCEGSKKWYLHSHPLADLTRLPSWSSRDFKPDELDVIAAFTLSPGDLLYMPRGIIHQARAVPKQHSLHLTISTHQKNTWTDFLKILFPKMLEKAMREDVMFRESLPIDFLYKTGLLHTDNKRRLEFRGQVEEKLERLLGGVTRFRQAVSDAVDEMGTQFVRDSLRPVHSGVAGKMAKSETAKNSKCKITADSRVRLVSLASFRVVQTELGLYLHQSAQNGRNLRECQPLVTQIDDETKEIIAQLTHVFPKFCKVSDFSPHFTARNPANDEDQEEINEELVEIVAQLFDIELLVLK